MVPAAVLKEPPGHPLGMKEDDHDAPRAGPSVPEADPSPSSSPTTLDPPGSFHVARGAKRTELVHVWPDGRPTAGEIPADAPDAEPGDRLVYRRVEGRTIIAVHMRGDEIMSTARVTPGSGDCPLRQHLRRRA